KTSSSKLQAARCVLYGFLSFKFERKVSQRPSTNGRWCGVCFQHGARTFLSAAISERQQGPNFGAHSPKPAAADRNVRAPRKGRHADLVFGYWFLELVWSLDVGAWSFSGGAFRRISNPFGWSLVFI